ncbi:outer membrane beta-barrel protein, partial [Ramlibacter alkalitolerans]
MTTRQYSSMGYRLGAVTLAVLGATTGAPALAQPLATPHWYVGGNVGRTNSQFENDDTFGLVPPAAVASFRDDDSATGYKLYGGYQLNRIFAFEAGFFHLGTYDFGFTTVAPVGTLDASTRFRGANIDLVAGWPVFDRFSVFGRIGAAWTQARSTATRGGALGAATISDRERKWGPKVGLGLEYAITPTLGVRAEWERYRVRDPLRGRDDIDMASIGLVWRFGAPAVVPVRTVAPPPPPPRPPPPPPP